MRFTAALMKASLLACATLAAATTAVINTNTAGGAETRGGSDSGIEQIGRRQVQAELTPAGGMAVARNLDGRTLFFNYGPADVARKTPITSDSLLNLASVGKAFIATLLAQAVKQGEVSLDDPVAKYVTELQQGGDVRKVTLGMLATHTSGLTRTPQQYEPWHRGPYTLPDFIRYLNSWKADDAHTPGKQDIYSNTGFVLLALALQRRFDTPIAELLQARLAPRHDVDRIAGEQREWPQGACSRASPPRGAGLQRRCEARGRAGQPAGHLQLAGRRADLFLRPRHGALPRRQSRRAAGCTRAERSDGVRAAGRLQGECALHPGARLAARDQRRSSHRRQERRPQQHLDLYRHDSRCAARRGASLQLRRRARHPHRPADLARARA